MRTPRILDDPISAAVLHCAISDSQHIMVQSSAVTLLVIVIHPTTVEVKILGTGIDGDGEWTMSPELFNCGSNGVFHTVLQRVGHVIRPHTLIESRGAMWMTAIHSSCSPLADRNTPTGIKLLTVHHNLFGQVLAIVVMAPSRLIHVRPIGRCRGHTAAIGMKHPVEPLPVQSSVTAVVSVAPTAIHQVLLGYLRWVLVSFGIIASHVGKLALDGPSRTKTPTRATRPLIFGRRHKPAPAACVSLPVGSPSY
mmetsp:Transcript_48193/g.81114  ORF Transcript_48193/g.81114 Transcript_48193/m.81114 type:complete len:252 (+) Transcript_48193:577-1332(+)